MARNPEKRALSREIDKERKRARRAIARLQKQVQETNNVMLKRKANAQIADLQRNIANLSATGKTKTYSEAAQEALSSLKGKRVGTQRELASVQIDFQSEVNAARRGEISFFSTRGKERVQLFYKATQPLWEGKPMAERNESIMKALGVRSMRQAFIKVYQQKEVQEVWKQLNTSGGPVSDTDDMVQAYMQAQRTNYTGGSPIEFANSALTEWTKAYAQ